MAILKNTNKVNDMTGIKSKTDLYNALLARYVNEVGGVDNAIQIIKDCNGDISRKAVSDIRAKFNALPKDNDGLPIDELTTKVLESLRVAR